MVGIDELSAKKILLWGSERDLFTGTVETKAKINNWLTNTIWLNSFRMTQTDLKHFAKVINTFKPQLIRGYASSLYEFSKFVEKENLSIHTPKAIISSAETLNDMFRDKIEKTFGVKVYNFYGSRETSAIAGECDCGLMHKFTFNQFTEVLDENNQPTPEGLMGRVIVTTLHNFSMPLIRFEIGDTAVVGTPKCKCGNPLPTLKQVTGRVTDHFIKQDKTVIYGEYFTHLFYGREWVEAFQIIQEEYDKVRILLVLQSNIIDTDKKDIEKKIRLVMGKNCTIIWDVVSEIKPTKSGKRLYTKSLVTPE